MTWKSGLKVSLLPLGPPYPLQTILLRDLVGCVSPLQIVIAVFHPFFKFGARQTANIVCRGLPHPTQQVPILKKVHQTAMDISERFPSAEKTSEDITRRLFLMNIKG